MVAAGLGLLTGCTQKDEASKEPSSVAKPVQQDPMSIPGRTYDFSQMTRGRKLYLENCAVCHGGNAEGSHNWRQRDTVGKFPPPPLNGTGHTWHHPMKALRMTIRDGTQKIGGKMPAWGDKLSEQEINDIIAWFQGQWPQEIYQAWYERNEKSK